MKKSTMINIKPAIRNSVILITTCIIIIHFLHCKQANVQHRKSIDSFQKVVTDFSSYYGGTNSDDGRGIGVDRYGNIYICGNTISHDIPVVNAFQHHFKGRPNDIYTAKFNPAGDSLIFATYIGGSLRDECKAFAVDPDGNAYITGRTNSPDFPTTEMAFGKTLTATYDIIVVKLNPEGKIIYSNIFGGESMEEARGIAVDEHGNCIVTGGTHSTDFPTTTESYCPIYNDKKEPDPLKKKGEPFQAEDAFVSKISSDGSELLFSTYLGGHGHDKAWAATIDDKCNVIVAGHTRCQDFPTTNFAIQTENRGGQDAFVAILSPDGKSLEYASYIGSSGTDKAAGVAVDNAGNIWISGNTDSTDLGFADSNGTEYAGGKTDLFLLKISPEQSSPLFFTLWGGSAEDELASDGLVVSQGHEIIMTGATQSRDFPEIHGKHRGIPNTKNCFVAKFEAMSEKCLYSYTFGGSQNDQCRAASATNSGIDFFIGTSISADIPIAGRAFQKEIAGKSDIIIFRTIAKKQERLK